MTMNLSDYVKRRNGVSMGAPSSLKNMLERSLGAGKFSTFWKFWNPIWSYYLGKYIFKPLKTFLPPSLALLLTFGVCGFVHDLVIMLLRRDFALLFTFWFLTMGLWLVISDYLKIDYGRYAWVSRACINTASIGICFLLACQLQL